MREHYGVINVPEPRSLKNWGEGNISTDSYFRKVFVRLILVTFCGSLCHLQLQYSKQLICHMKSGSPQSLVLLSMVSFA